MLEGGGKTPILNPQELDQVGYKLAVYPLSLMGVSIRAMQVTIHMSFYTFSLMFPLINDNSIGHAKRDSNTQLSVRIAVLHELHLYLSCKTPF